MDALEERCLLHPMHGSTFVMVVVVVAVIALDIGDGRRSADEGKNLIPILAFLAGSLCRVGGVDQGEPEHFAECVG
jgi:hypothetical protein